MSAILKTGEITGLRTGDSYDAVVSVLGEAPSPGDETSPGYCYGDLEIWFERGKGLGTSSLIYLNGGRRKAPIRVRSHLPFRSEGLRWGMAPGEFCCWAIDHRVSFAYRSDPAWEASRESIKIGLTDVGKRYGAIFDANGMDQRSFPKSIFR